MNVGIDKIGIYIPKYRMDMRQLAIHRSVDPDKWTIGIGQEQMAVPDLSNDVVAMAANAAASILTQEDKSVIDQIIVGTESGVDFSKSIATYVHQLLEIQPFCKSFEVKQACYGATAGLQMACDYVRLHPKRKVLVIATDIAKYGLNTTGEPTQGAGAVAMLISKDPKIMSLEMVSYMHTNSQHDFWRPNYSHYAMVDGHFSTQLYVDEFIQILDHANKKNSELLESIEAMVFHLPFTKMGMKAIKGYEEYTHSDALTNKWRGHYDAASILNKQVGNIYTGSLFLSLLSLLIHDETLIPGTRIGLFSYGSGAVSELLIGNLQTDYREAINVTTIQLHLDRRVNLEVLEYETLFLSELELVEGNSKEVTALESGYYFKGIYNHKRLYGYYHEKA